MSETPEVIDLTDDQEHADLSQSGTPEPESTPEPDDTEDREPRGGEARKYRKRAQEAEAERDTLQGQLETARKHIAESISGLHKPEALWAAGATVDDVLDDDGNVDPNKVRAAVDAASDRLGLSRTPRPDYTQGAAGAPPQSPSEGFAAAFGPR